MNLYLVEQQGGQIVLVVDRETHLCVARFYYHKDQDGVPAYDALVLANEFIYAMRALEKEKNGPRTSR